MSAPVSAVAARLLRLGAEVAASALEGREPDPARIVRELVGVGLDVVSADELRGHLSDEARRRIDAELDLEQRLKTGG